MANNNIVQIIVLLFGYSLILILLCAAITFILKDISPKIGELILCGIFGALMGSGTLKRLKRGVNIVTTGAIDEDQVDGIIPVNRPIFKRTRSRTLNMSGADDTI